MQGFDALHAGIDGFDKTGLLEGNAVRNTYGTVLNNPVHDANVLGEAAAGRLEAGGATDFFVGRALGESLVLAVETLAARNVVEDHDAVAGAKVADALADGGDNAGGFVSENSRGGVRAGRNLLEVGAANAAGVNADKEFSWADSGDRNGFEADVVYAAIDRSLHGRWNRAWVGLDSILSDEGHQAILDDVGDRDGAKGGMGENRG